ncbi:MAG: hypothetical protein ACR2K1_11050, partial [Saprospiraceae bacterium]
MKRILILLILAVLGALGRTAAQSVTAAEYFINTDPGVGNGTPIAIPTPGDTVTGSFSLDVTGLTPGFHNLYIRGRNSAGFWGFLHRQNFYVSPPPAPAPPPVAEQIVAAEIFIHTDPGVGKGTPVAIPTPGDTVSLQNIPYTITQCLNPGVYRMYVRGRNAAGQWGFLSSAEITIQNPNANILSLTHQPASDCGITSSENFQITVTNTGQSVLPAGIVQVQLVVSGANTGTFGPFLNTAAINPGAQAVISATGVNLSSPGQNTVAASFVVCENAPPGNAISIQVSGQANQIPTVNTVPNQNLCNGVPAQITFSGNNPAATYSWTNDNPAIGLSASGTGSLSFNPTNTGNAPITATLSVTPSAGSCTGVAKTFTITVNPGPTAQISGTPGFCPGGTTSLTASGGTGFAWNTLENTTSITVNTAGTYTVTVTSANGCTDAESVQVQAFAAPPAAISGPSSFCTGESAALTASGGASYAWSTGASTAAITVTAADTYTVTVTDANGCTGTAASTVSEVTSLAVTIGGDTELCAGEGTTLSAGVNVSYLWSTGSTSQAISVTSAGTYTVTVSSGQGCTGSGSVTVDVNPLPTAGISGDLSLCVGAASALTAMVGAPVLWNKQWPANLLDYGSSGLEVNNFVGWSNAAKTAAVTGDFSMEYTIEVVASGNQASCMFGYAKSDPPLTQIPFLENTRLLYLDQGTNINYYSNAWETPPQSSAQNGNILTFRIDRVGGLVTYALTGSNPARSGVIESNYTGPVYPTVAFFGAGCRLNNFQLLLPGTSDYSYLWSTSATTAAITASSAGTYAVTVSNDNGCTDVASAQLQALPATQAAISGSTGFCTGGSATLTASGGIFYAWSTGASTAIITVSAAGTYTVTVTDANGCTGTATTTVTVNTGPTVQITGDTEICSNETTALSAAAGAAYLWSTGATSQTISAGAAGTYTVTVTAANSCTGTATATLSVQTAPDAVISGDPEACAGQSVTLTASGGDQLLWSTGSSAAEIVLNQGGTYSVTATNTNGCTDVASVSVNISQTTFQVDVSVTPETCVGVGDGAVALTITGGIQPFSYLWNNQANTSSISGLSAGAYAVTITDNGGCVQTATADVCLQCKAFAGTLQHWSDATSRIPGASVALGLNGSGTVATGADGRYLLTAASGANFSIVPTKTAARIAGVTTADLTRIQRHIAFVE